MGKNIIPIIVVILFAAIAGFPLLHKGLPPTHDGEHHVIRFYEFYKALQDGEWYPRWAPDLNYGYGVPLFNYVYPLPNYVAFFLHFLGISFIDAFKLNMFFAIILGSVFFYLWSKQFWGTLGGIVSSVFYTYSPYHFLDIYIRGSVGEVWALALFPPFLWSVTIFLVHKKKIFLPISSIFLGLMVFSHNILALMFFIFSLFYISLLVFQSKNKKYLIRNSFILIFLGIGLSSVFWLPALLEQRYVTGLQIYNIENNFPDLYQLLIPSWGSGFSGENLQNQMSFQIGIANLFVVAISLLIIVLHKKDLNHRFILFFSLVSFMIVFFFMLKSSLPIWKMVPFMNYFQFPWRFLSLEIVIASFLAGSIVQVWQSRLFVGLLLFLTFILGIGYTKPAYYHYRDDAYYISRSNFIDGTNSPGNLFNTIWMRKDLNRVKDKIKIVGGDGEVRYKSITTSKYLFDLNTKQDTKILVHTAYFPGWFASVNGVEVETNPSPDGLISFSLPKGNHAVQVKLADTLVRTIAKITSIISVFGVILLFLKARYTIIL